MRNDPRQENSVVLRQGYQRRDPEELARYLSTLSDNELARLNQERLRLGLEPFKAIQPKGPPPNGLAEHNAVGSLGDLSAPFIDRRSAALEDQAYARDQIRIPDLRHKKRPDGTSATTRRGRKTASKQVARKRAPGLSLLQILTLPIAFILAISFHTVARISRSAQSSGKTRKAGRSTRNNAAPTAGTPENMPNLRLLDFSRETPAGKAHSRQRISQKNSSRAQTQTRSPEHRAPDNRGRRTAEVPRGYSRRTFLALGTAGIAAGIAAAARLEKEYRSMPTPEEVKKIQEENERALRTAKIAAITPDAETLVLFKQRRTDPARAFRKGDKGKDVLYFQRILQTLKDNGRLAAPSWWTDTDKKDFEALHVRATGIFDQATLRAASALAQQNGLFIESRKGVTGVLTIEKSLSLLCEVPWLGEDTVRGIFGEPVDCDSTVKQMLRPIYIGSDGQVCVYGKTCNASSVASLEGDALFKTTVDCLIEREGVYSNDSDDKGGPTKFGISTPVHEELKKSKDPELQRIGGIALEELEISDVEKVYKAIYWRNDLSGPTAFVYLFASVHCGKDWANTTLSNICSTCGCVSSKIPAKDNDKVAFAFICALAAHYERLYYNDPAAFDDFQLGFGQRAAYVCANTFPPRTAGFLYMKTELLAQKPEK